MSRSLLYSCVILAMTSADGLAQVGDPGIQYSTQIAAGDGGQLYPYDRQDPWLHGHYQRIPAYGGFASYRPYNYRHVFAQTQIAGQWGLPHGMPYSQQFWNKYRGSYLDGNLHSQVVPNAAPLTLGQLQSPGQFPSHSQFQPAVQFPLYPAAAPVYRASYDESARPVAQPATAHAVTVQPAHKTAQPQSPPIHIFPAGLPQR